MEPRETEIYRWKQEERISKKELILEVILCLLVASVFCGLAAFVLMF